MFQVEVMYFKADVQIEYSSLMFVIVDVGAPQIKITLRRIRGKARNEI